jgi:hypothetical protein
LGEIGDKAEDHMNVDHGLLGIDLDKGLLYEEWNEVSQSMAAENIVG